MEELLGTPVSVVVDRPLGCVSPNHGHIYSLNYGYLPKVYSGKKEVKAYIIGVFEPVDRFDGEVVAVINRTKSEKYKLVVAKEKGRYTKEQILALVEFRERHHESTITMAT